MTAATTLQHACVAALSLRLLKAKPTCSVTGWPQSLAHVGSMRIFTFIYWGYLVAKETGE